ncbi:ABC transporter substrate-binding protein [Candidatus Sororendozoicomonas aggregata]|uniref:ABC transporter substrate-binding protein n=1 Tax=Candidatus Sororendozoicomonas aggregata TaxID=3073239 RepID=UPI002ED61C2F
MQKPRGRRLRKTLPFFLLMFFGLTSNGVFAASVSNNAVPSPWERVQQEATGQTVYFNAWGGDERINSYIRWASDELKQQYDIDLKLVKIDDTSTVISRLLSEKSIGRDTEGSVDLVWINGENFRAMKKNGLLSGPFTLELPSMKYIDPVEKPTAFVDFGEPVDGMEAPWGMAQLVFMYDSARVKSPPKSALDLLAFAKMYPGRVTYPSPPDFIGTTFLKQLLTELATHPAVLQKPIKPGQFSTVTKPLWDYLDQLHPLLWREGKLFPRNHLSMTPMLDDGEILLSMTFNPLYASAAMEKGELAPSVRTYVHKGGVLGNTHFLAIPYNSSAKAAAKVAINFLMSPRAQARKADPRVWGDPTVLTMSRLSEQDRQRFNALAKGQATLTAQQLGSVLPEPHVSWVEALEKAWVERYR